MKICRKMKVCRKIGDSDFGRREERKASQKTPRKLSTRHLFVPLREYEEAPPLAQSDKEETA
jgi:hypothetical protein